MGQRTVKGLVHDFQERLEHSQDLSDEGHWVHFYQRLWPDLLMAVRVDAHSQFQKWGIDREIYLPSGRRILVDEKKRDKDYGDLLLEEWSVGNFVNGVYVGEKIGWALDKTKRCDFVAYAIPSVGKCYLLPFELTRQAFSHNLEKWKRRPLANGKPSYPKDAPNRGYFTRNVAVDWKEFKRALGEQMLRKFGEPIKLPEPTHNGEQLEFEW